MAFFPSTSPVNEITSCLETWTWTYGYIFTPTCEKKDTKKTPRYHKTNTRVERYDYYGSERTKPKKTKSSLLSKKTREHFNFPHPCQFLTVYANWRPNLGWCNSPETVWMTFAHQNISSQQEKHWAISYPTHFVLPEIKITTFPSTQRKKKSGGRIQECANRFVRRNHHSFCPE